MNGLNLRSFVRALRSSAVLLSLSALAVRGQTPAPSVITRDAMQLLKAECFSCHNEKKQKGGLVMTSREALLKGSDSGPVAEPGDPASSILAKALLADADPHMPPKKQLTEPQIQLLRDWIQAGIVWDDTALTQDDSISGPVELSTLPQSYQPILSLSLSPDGKRLAVGRGGSIVVHETAEKQYPVLHTIAAHRDAVQSLAWSADGRWLASGAFRRVVLWDATTFTPAHEWNEGLAGRITALKFSPDSSKLLLAEGVAGQSGFVRVINVSERQLLNSWHAHDDTIFGLEFSPDGTRIATAGGDKLIKLWELETRKELARLEGHSAQVLSVAFNTDATQLVSGGADAELNVWDVQTREKIISLGKHTTAVTAVSWPGDGKAVIAATGNGVFAYTNLTPHSGAERSKGGDEKKIGETTDAALTLVSNPDASVIAAGGHDGVVHLWNREGTLLSKLEPSSEEQAVASAKKEEQKAAGNEVTAPATALKAGSNSSTNQPVSFLRDVLPGLSRAGCSTGSCHAKAEGQNGFKLSVFAYDPKSDYEAIVKSARGRRVFPSAPDQSLIVQKPTTTLDHEGGRRFEKGSEIHQLLVRWMSEGMHYQVPNEPDLKRITVSPKTRTYEKSAAQPLRVEAHYSDGSTRDVTQLAAFASNDTEMAAVNEDGVVTAGTLAGQAVVVARYMGLVADSQITIPPDRLLPKARYASLPRNNFIDEHAYAQFQPLGLFPSELSSDAEFLRRAKLDAVGLLPTPDEVQAFLADRSPTKRREAIARILEEPAYADYWATKWADLVRPNPDRVGLKSVFTLDQWLRQSFRENKPYDQFAREILLAEGTNHRDGPAVIYRDRREPADRTTMFSQVFLGTRLECARCHNHPNEKWTQNDFYSFAAFFGPMKQKGTAVSPPISAGTETFYFASGGNVKHPVTGEVMSPRPLDAAYKPAPTGTDPRRALVESLTAPDNPYFASAAVNRVWANFFGRGLVEPVDDFRITNPCVNPPLLAALARDFVEHGYDLKHLMRTIMESRLYQLSSTPNEFNLTDTRNFSRAYRRRLPAEVLLDAVNEATEASDTFAGMPPGTRATQAWCYKIESQFMDAFSRPDPSMDPPCERDTHISVVQSLHLMNSKALQTKLSSASGRARRLAESDKSPREIVNALYLATLSRAPDEDELAVATASFAAADATRQSATEDVFWALLNSAEFVFNH
jgi:WD40 repeat protein